jgi:hypothetical protein
MNDRLRLWSHAGSARRWGILGAYLLMTAALGLGSGSAPVLAQPPSQTSILDVAMPRTIPAAACAPEIVELAGTMHVVLRTGVSGGGAKTIDVSIKLSTVEAKGQKSGADYRLDNQGRDRQQYQCAPGVPCLTSLIGPFTVVGTGPDHEVPGALLLRFKADPHGRVTADFLDVRFSCPQ